MKNFVKTTAKLYFRAGYLAKPTIKLYLYIRNDENMVSTVRKLWFICFTFI